MTTLLEEAQILLEECQEDINRISRFPVGSPVYTGELRFYKDKIKVAFGKIDLIIAQIRA